MQTLCGHISLEIYVSTMSAQHLTKNIYVSRARCCADIVRTLCGHLSLEIYVHTMSALCLHNVRTMSAQQLPRETYILRTRVVVRTLCGHISPGIYVRTMSALYPSSVFSSENLPRPRIKLYPLRGEITVRADAWVNKVNIATDTASNTL